MKEENLLKEIPADVEDFAAHVQSHYWRLPEPTWRLNYCSSFCALWLQHQLHGGTLHLLQKHLTLPSSWRNQDGQLCREWFECGTDLSQSRFHRTQVAVVADVWNGGQGVLLLWTLCHIAAQANLCQPFSWTHATRVMRRLFWKKAGSEERRAWRPAPDGLRAAASRPSCPRGKKSGRVEVVLTVQEVDWRPTIFGQVFTHLLKVQLQVEHKRRRHLSSKNLTAPEPCQNWTIWRNWESKSTLAIFTECRLSLLYNFAILARGSHHHLEDAIRDIGRWISNIRFTTGAWEIHRMHKGRHSPTKWKKSEGTFWS